MKEVCLSNYLSHTITENSRKARHFFFYAVAALVTASVLGVAIDPIFAYPGVLVCLVFAGFGGVTQSKNQTFRAGLEGEIALKNTLRGLSANEYTAYYNVPLPGGYGDLDALLVGPGCVFAIEVKSHSGKISFDGHKWQQTKTGRQGTEYRGGLKNPSAQLMHAIQLLKKYLSDKGAHTWIDGILVFTHPESQLQISGKTCLRIVQIQDLAGIVTGNYRKITPETLAKIDQALNALRQK